MDFFWKLNEVKIVIDSLNDTTAHTLFRSIENEMKQKLQTRDKNLIAGFYNFQNVTSFEIGQEKNISAKLFTYNEPLLANLILFNEIKVNLCGSFIFYARLILLPVNIDNNTLITSNFTYCQGLGGTRGYVERTPKQPPTTSLFYYIPNNSSGLCKKSTTKDFSNWIKI